jgi:hypothetical protein
MLHAYAKSNKLSSSLIQSFLHEMLILGMKLDKYDEDIFIEYLKKPIERCYDLNENYEKYNQRGVKKQQKWNNIFLNIQS